MFYKNNTFRNTWYYIQWYNMIYPMLLSISLVSFGLLGVNESGTYNSIDICTTISITYTQITQIHTFNLVMFSQMDSSDWIFIWYRIPWHLIEMFIKWTLCTITADKYDFYIWTCEFEMSVECFQILTDWNATRTLKWKR